MLDRKTAPLAPPLQARPLPRSETYTLPNGLPVHSLQHGEAPIVNLRLVYRAGTDRQQKAGQARYTLLNLTEGTQNFDSQQLAQRLDDFGAWISADADDLDCAIDLVCLERHLENTLPILKEVAFHPRFPEKEFELMRNRNLQKLEVDARKTSFQATRHFRRYHYGENHPYGYTLGPDELSALRREDMLAYYERFINLGNANIILTGRFDPDKVRGQLARAFGGLERKTSTVEESPAVKAQARRETGRKHIPVAGMQSTLCLGHAAIARDHPDYYALELTTTLFGGYFGSRLMKKIREEKGYTYGIYGIVRAAAFDGHLLVRGDVGNEYVEDTIAEVKSEMRALQNEPPSEEELEIVKNYLIGRNISRRETAFQMNDLLRFSLSNGISFPELDRRFEVIQAAQVETVQEMAKKYFRPEALLEVVAGGEPAEVS